MIFDIIQPHRPQLQRILCVVHGLEEDASKIVVQKDANDVGVLYTGSIFNIYTRPKSNLSHWDAVQLRIVDDDYDDGLDFTTLNQLQAVESKRRTGRVKKLSFTPAFVDIFNYPVPVSYTPTGEPYFAPPVHIPAYPSGYNKCYLPYYGKTPVVKVIPLGLTAKGTRYYSEERAKGPVDFAIQKHQLAGYDAEGHPFYVPRGFAIPPPSGFTADGIPFYDISTLIRQQGEFALPAVFKDSSVTPGESDGWEELLPLIQGLAPSASQRRIEAQFQKKLLTHLQESHLVLSKALVLARNRLINPSSGKRVYSQFVPREVSVVSDPENISAFLREGFAFSHLRPQPIRVTLEPSQCDFHSARSPATKSIALRYKAGRGDHTERDFYLAIEPAGVFSIKNFHFRLQGEGVQEIAVTFYPRAMTGSTAEGKLHVFDRFGRKMFTSRLNGVKKSFFKTSPSHLDIGWVLIDKKKEATILIENLADYQINVNFQVGVKALIKSSVVSPFSLDTDSIKLKARESISVLVTFHPKVSGRFIESLKFYGPGKQLL